MRLKLQNQIMLKAEENEEIARQVRVFTPTGGIGEVETQDFTKESIQSGNKDARFNTNRRLGIPMESETAGSSRNRALTVDEQKKRILQLNISTINDKDTDNRPVTGVQFKLQSDMQSEHMSGI